MSLDTCAGERLVPYNIDGEVSLVRLTGEGRVLFNSEGQVSSDTCAIERLVPYNSVGEVSLVSVTDERRVLFNIEGQVSLVRCAVEKSGTIQRCRPSVLSQTYRRKLLRNCCG